MRVLVVVALAGCFPTRSAELACDVTADCEAGRVCENGFCVVASVDAGANEPDAATFDCTGFSGRHFVGCDIPQPSAGLVLEAAGTYKYDTDLGILISPASEVSTPANLVTPAGRVISIEKLTIGTGAKLRVIGAKPLIVASWSTIAITGTVDASSNAIERGAGANPAECTTHAAEPGGNDIGGSGAGGGAGFGGAGGQGGGGNDDDNGGTGGAAIAAPLLLGGCAGGIGGTGNAAGGAGGNGGGAIQLTARESITISGTIHASGSGGGGAAGDNGAGGGGGSGGMIGLESATVTLTATAVLAANGGGGGGGSGGGAALAGQDGLASATRAIAGAGVDDGSPGGPGGAAATLTGAPGIDDSDRGGGGGGGGVGFIVIASPTMTPSGIVSPAVTRVAR